MKRMVDMNAGITTPLPNTTTKKVIKFLNLNKMVIEVTLDVPKILFTNHCLTMDLFAALSIPLMKNPSLSIVVKNQKDLNS